MVRCELRGLMLQRFDLNQTRCSVDMQLSFRSFVAVRLYILQAVAGADIDRGNKMKLLRTRDEVPGCPAINVGEDIAGGALEPMRSRLNTAAVTWHAGFEAQSEFAQQAPQIKIDACASREPRAIRPM